MKKTVLLILIALTGCKIKDIETNNVSLKETILEINFYPSSINSCAIRIDTSASTKNITLIIKKSKDIDEVESALSRRIKLEDYEGIIYALSKLDSVNYKQKEGQGKQEVTGKITYTTADTIKALNFSSPTRESDEVLYDDLLDPVFLITSKYFTEGTEMAYLEQLEQYFQYGFPLKIISNRPKVFRLYGRLVYTKETEENLTNFIDYIPSKEPVVIDMSNFSSMASEFQRAFKNLVRKSSKIKWVSSTPEQLMELGVKKEDIYPTKEAALKSISHYKYNKTSDKESCS